MLHCILFIFFQVFDLTISFVWIVSPGTMIAVGSSKSIYVYTCSSNNQVKKIHVYRGHSSSIVSLDWCSNSVYIQSNDQAKEILYWNVTTGTQVTKTTAMRDVDWHTWTCLYGWPVRGVYHPEISDNNNDAISVCRTRSGQHMITSDSLNRSSGDIAGTRGAHD